MAAATFLVAAAILILAPLLSLPLLRRARDQWRSLGFICIPFVGGVIASFLNYNRLHDYGVELCRSLKTFRSPFPGFSHIYTADPANIEYALKTNFHNYIKGSFVYDKQQEFLGNGIFSVDGMEWKHQRKTASYEFSSRALRDLCEVAFQANALRLASYLLVEAKELNTVEMQDLFLRLTFDSFSKIGFGLETCTLQKDPPAEQLAFVHAFDECNAQLFVRYGDPLWRIKRYFALGNEAEFARHVSTLNRTVQSFIDDRQRYRCDVKADLLSRFLELKKDNPEEFSDKKIRDIIINFLIAGRDTTALTLSWFFYALSQNPSVENKILEELYRLEGLTQETCVTNGLPTEDQMKCFARHLVYENLTKLQYLQACLQETLRLYPPVPIALRVAAAADTLPDGTKVRKGDTVNVCSYVMGRMEWLWGDDASEFKPERFMRGGTCQQESPFKLAAFLGGPRMCPGKDFAFLQMKVTAAILLRFFRYEIVPGHKVRYRPMITLHMSRRGLRMRVLPRSRKTA